jgi:hypothetical protein
VSLGKAAAKVTRFLGLQPNSDLDKMVESGSPFQDILTHDWKERVLDYQIVSFYEEVGDVWHFPQFRSMFNETVNTDPLLDCSNDQCRLQLAGRP